MQAGCARGGIPGAPNFAYAEGATDRLFRRTPALDILAALGAPPPPLVLFAALLAGTVRGYTGFGSAMIFMPVAGAYLGPKTAIGIMWIIDFLMQLPMVRSTWRHARWGEIGPLFIGYVVGLPLGLTLLMTIDPTPVRWVTSLSS